METKACTKCGEVKALDAFRRSYKTKISRRSHCRSCEAREAADRRNANPEKERSRKAEWAKKNKDIENARARLRRANNPEKYKAVNALRPKREKQISREISKRAIQRASRSYCASLLKIPVADCPPELIALKREQLQLFRLTKQLNKAIKDAQK